METPASAWQQARLVEVALARTQMHCYALGVSQLVKRLLCNVKPTPVRKNRTSGLGRHGTLADAPQRLTEGSGLAAFERN